jgi:Tol biopolymer transport system component
VNPVVIDERWARISALFQAAVERPAAERDRFLAAATAGDSDLRREVESLLASDAADAGLFDRLPHAAEAVLANLRMFTAAPTDLLKSHPIFKPGSRIGSYEVISSIGAGGMGEVYRTRDTKLNRDVALKVLPALFAGDPDRLARFRREAQMVAALNHPNVGAIYGLEESSGVQALVLELVEGPTLADRIAQGPMALDVALPIARQIAEALEAAHEQGIVHRDLKPANVKVRPDGVVKVLDFGLAKALAPPSVASNPAQSPTLSHAATREGIILGTAAYMAPEQAKGQAVDRRVDIWAFGCVLFEMLVGQPAFRGETVTDLLAAVVKDEPDWSALPSGLPTGVHTLLRRCLKKDPRQRLQAIGDARIEIDAINEGRAGVSEVSGVRSLPTTLTRWLPWAALVALAASVVVWEAWRATATSKNEVLNAGDPARDRALYPLANAQYTRVTDWEGTEGSAEISPDGRFVAFVSDRAGELDVWVNPVGTKDYRNLTADFPALEASGYMFRRLGFSDNGAEIWFSPATGPAMAQMIVPIIGGTPRAFLDKAGTAPAWSPDGSRLTYFKNQDGDPLFVADRTGADARQILVGEHNHNPVWSSDGQWIYFARGAEPTEAMEVWRVRPSGESAERLTDRGVPVNSVAPLDTRTLVYVTRTDRSGLWALDVERKVARRVASGLGQYMTVSASRDGHRVVATVANPTATLWRVPLLDRQAGDRDVQPYSLPTARALAPRFAGTTLFYLSAGGSGDALWRLQDGQASEVSKGTEAGLNEPASVSRDGSRVAIVVRREGQRRLMIVSADGRNSQTLAPSLAIEGAAGQGATDWSPDGKWIVAGATIGQDSGLFKISVDGGEPVRLVRGQASNPVWSPDGKVILYSGKFFTGQVDVLGVRPDGTPVDLPSVRTRPGGYRFLPNGSGLVYLPFMPSLDFWLVDFTTKKQRQLTRLSNHGALGTFDITPDGKAIVFDRSRENSDIVLIDLPKP